MKRGIWHISYDSDGTPSNNLSCGDWSVRHSFARYTRTDVKDSTTDTSSKLGTITDPLVGLCGLVRTFCRSLAKNSFFNDKIGLSL